MDLTTIPWQFKAGVETTWCIDRAKFGKYHGRHGEPSCGGIACYMRMFSNIPRRMIHALGQDPGVVEIPTRPMTSWKEFKTIYETIRGECERFNLIPRYQHEAGGDGHIHASGLSHNEKIYLFRDMVQRPYVSWAFIHPNDDINARTLTRWVSAGYRYMSNDWPTDKSFAVVYRNNISEPTVEFRLFWTPNDWQEQMEHMAFVQAYLGKIRKEVAEGKQAPVIPSKEDGQKILEKYSKNFSRCEREFRKLIEWIGLDPKHYAKNVARMKVRFTEHSDKLY